MQKIIIENFGPVKNAEIEITPLLVLIGEQATGKSTIAKLIYFFKTLSDEFLTRSFARQDDENTNTDLLYKRLFFSIIRRKFLDFFGSPTRMSDFKIHYQYNKEKYITISKTNIRMSVKFSDDFFGKEQLTEFSKAQRALFDFRKDMENEGFSINNFVFETLQKNAFDVCTRIINNMFCNTHNDSLYVVAGRNATVGYSNFYEGMLAANLQNKMEGSIKLKSQTIDETLMLEFLQHVSDMRKLLNKSGNFEGIIKDSPKEKKDILTLANSLILKVIRGNYSSGIDEKIIIEKGKQTVFLRNASSGQQESIRILQDAFIAINSDNNVFRIIEEPEAHIFPEAQMYMLELLAMLLNNKEENQMIITTHSPYVLTVINNLMYAYKVGQKNPEKAGEIVNKHSWLAPEKVNAYMLTAANGAERIIDDELGMIKAERIDEVSRTLNEDYDKLLDIEYEKE